MTKKLSSTRFSPLFLEIIKKDINQGNTFNLKDALYSRNWSVAYNITVIRRSQFMFT